MKKLQNLVENYLLSADFSMLDKKEGFIVADKLQLGGDHDTRLIWVAPPSTDIKEPFQFKEKLLEEFDKTIPEYPNAKYFMVVYSLEKLSRDFRSEASRLRVKIRTKMQFFDAPFRDESSGSRDNLISGKSFTTSAISDLRDFKSEVKRAPQPYTIIANGKSIKRGKDLLPTLFNELKYDDLKKELNPCLRIVVGAAGAGKSVLFNYLFSQLYNHFLENKRKNIISPRPIPLIPAYLREATSIRTNALIENFLRTEVAAPVPRKTFEWMLLNNFSTWFFDGLDELYAGESGFFDNILEFLTAPKNHSQILICARDSLLKTSETFATFLEEFNILSPEAPVHVYHLDDWDYSSKRAFFWLKLKNRLPKKDEVDTSNISKILNAINKSTSLKELSNLPYYCDLIFNLFLQNNLSEFKDDFDLINHAINGIIQREKEKKLLSLDHFEKNGLNDMLEQVAFDFYQSKFKAVDESDIRGYAKLVLRNNILPKDENNDVTTLIQFPLFAPGLRLGEIMFKHELVAEFLTSRFLAKRIIEKPGWVGRTLGNRSDFSGSLIARYLASFLAKNQNGIELIIKTLTTKSLLGNSFSNLLQLLLIANPDRKIIRSNQITFECKNLKYVKFENIDLENISFRNSDLTNTIFKECNLRNALFEGAILVGTKFENIDKKDMAGAQFGDLKRFEYVYPGDKKIENLKNMIEWIQKTTGISQDIPEPCPAALQLKALLNKFIYPNGQWRRSEVGENVITRGRRYPGAPSPQDCLKACLRFRYLQSSSRTKRIKLVSSEHSSDLICFIKNWEFSTNMKQLLNSLCKTSGCSHVPKSYYGV